MNEPTPLSRIDLEHNGAVPTLRGWTHDNRQVIYVLSAAEAAAVAKRLAGRPAWWTARLPGPSCGGPS